MQHDKSGFSFPEDIADMHEKFQVQKWMAKRIENGEYDILKAFLDFRMGCINEELNETKDAINKADPEEVVDGLIDILVFTLGTLDLYGVNATKAWKEVHRANIAKNVGIKEGRPNPFGLPDLIKPDGWEGPSHKGNTGIFKKVLKEKE